MARSPLPYYPKSSSARIPTERRWPIFGAKISSALKHKMAHIFHFFQTDMVFEVVNAFSCIFNAISSDKKGSLAWW